MRILVTGAFGVNGVWVLRRLLADGHEPVAMDLRPDFGLAPDLRDRVEAVSGDVTDLRGLLDLLTTHPAECVIHLAAFIPAEKDPFRGFTTNAQGMVNVLEAARLGGVRRLVFTSSRAVYAPFDGPYGPPDYTPVPETHEVAPLSAARVYSAAKIASEALGIQYAETYGLEFLALRFATIYGPGKKARHGPVGVHSRIVENALLGEPTIVDSGGDERDDMVYVKDVAQGIVRAALCPRPADHVFNIGSGRLSTLKDFARIVEQVIPGARASVGDGLDYLGFGRIYGTLDITLAHEQLGYEPEFDLAAGVLDFVETTRGLGVEVTAQHTQSRW